MAKVYFASPCSSSSSSSSENDNDGVNKSTTSCPVRVISNIHVLVGDIVIYVTILSSLTTSWRTLLHLCALNVSLLFFVCDGVHSH